MYERVRRGRERSSRGGEGGKGGRRAHLEVLVTSRRATPLGVRGPENTNLLTSFFTEVSLF